MRWCGANGQQFSTYDADHDGGPNYNCASAYGGGFWYDGPCGGDHITTSTSSYSFQWLTPTGWMSLNVVEVSLLCH